MTPDGKPLEARNAKRRRIIAGLIVIGGIIPLLLYGAYFGRVDWISPTQARERLLNQGEQTILVDVRDKGPFRKEHIDGAYNWPLADIVALRSPTEIPAPLRGKTLLMLCQAGYSSVAATRHLAALGVTDVHNVRGGWIEWIAGASGPEGGRFERIKTAAGETIGLPFRISPWHEQVAAVASGFAIKPTYTLLSLLLVAMLWRSRSSDLVALRWAMIFFFIGENFCAANYFIYRETSYLFEYLHSYGMLLCFGFTTYAVLEGMDRRIFMLSDPNHKCAALSLCGPCTKYSDVSCGLKHTFYVLIPACMVLACMPLCADRITVSYNTDIFGTFYNYSHRLVYQLFEALYCPAAAVLGMTMSLLILLIRRNDPLPAAKIAFAAGMGPLGFGMMRMILAGVYRQNQVWFTFWEEVTELLFIMGICCVLWIFRRGLFQRTEMSV